jgi:ferredoxin-NADP reductase
MDKHIVKVLETSELTHNVKRFVVQKPNGYSFQPGQATEIAINTEELRSQPRPFTFTSTNHSSELEFIIKIYKGHNGITEKLNEVKAGDELILHGVFGTIEYKGEGLFLAGGAGITPFVSIFRDLRLQGKTNNNTLLFANRSPEDIILEQELKAMLGKNYYDVLENHMGKESLSGPINKDLLLPYVNQNPGFYYICGPEKFTEAMISHLQELNVDKHKIVYEH